MRAYDTACPTIAPQVLAFITYYLVLDNACLRE